jgi:hypothetical protein
MRRFFYVSVLGDVALAGLVIHYVGYAVAVVCAFILVHVGTQVILHQRGAK